MANQAGEASPQLEPVAAFHPTRILVTGAAGFIASHLCDRLVSDFPGASIVAIDKMSYCSSLRNLDAALRNGVTFVRQDITDLDGVDWLFKTYRFDCVVHLAANTHVDHSFGNSLAFTRDNVVGTHTLLEAAKKHGVQRFVHISTDEIYGSHHAMSTEESPADPTNPYAASKAAAESLAKSYIRSFHTPIVIVRCNNVIGPRQYPEKLCPKFLLRLQRGLRLCIHGSGEQKRSFLYVADATEAMSLIIRRGVIGETYNIGTSGEFTVLEIAEKLIRLSKGADAAISDHLDMVEDRRFNDARYLISSEKLFRLTGWRPKWGIDAALAEIAKWYSAINAEAYWTQAEGSVQRAVIDAHPTVRIQ